jgi:hypothetical protein
MRFGLQTLFGLTSCAAISSWLLAGRDSPFVWIIAGALPVAAAALVVGRAAHWLLERESRAAQWVGEALLLMALLSLAASGGTILAGLVGFATYAAPPARAEAPVDDC